MDDVVSVKNYQDDVSDSCGLSKNEVIKLLYNQDNSITLIAPEKFKSPIWERFRVVHYKGVKLNFVQCIGCSLVLVYKSRTGTASLLRHRCARFPISVYDLKLAAAGHHIDLLNEMASSSHNGTIELKQELLSDEDSLETQDVNCDDDQQYTNEQTNKGLIESLSFLEKSFMTGEELMLSREEVELAQRNNDPDLFFERPRNHRHSATWDRFEIVYYRDIRQNFAKCLSCSSIVSYKKTTGTASLIRHKCKISKNHQQAVKVENHQQPVKSENLINLLTQSKTPPELTPAPVFDAPSSSSTAVSSTATIKQPSLVKSIRSENVSLLEIAGRNIALEQINWLSQTLVTSEIISDSTYLSFLQSLVNFGADFGKHKISNIINRNAICQHFIPRKCAEVQNELLSALRDTEFSISFRKWSNLRDEHYVTVFGYYFSSNFEYKNHILGTRRCDGDDDVMNVVKEISDGYKTVKDLKLKCICDEAEDDFEFFPCIVRRISIVIVTAMKVNTESERFFKKIYQLAHEHLNIPMKNSFEESSDDQKVRILFEFHQQLKANDDDQNDSAIERFMKLFGSLFSAISSLTETTEDGARCVSANKVYLWFKKLLKTYTSIKTEDEFACEILKSIETIKIHEIYQVAVFLDPNFKNLKFLDTSERNVLLDIVKKNLQKMMGDDDGTQNQSKRRKLDNNPPKSHVNDTFIEFMDITMESVDDQVNSEIQCYMGFKLENPVDIVEFWRDNDCFPYLKKLARNFLNLPSCTFHSNCCFLSASNELYQKCQNLPAEDIETLTFLHQNF